MLDHIVYHPFHVGHRSNKSRPMAKTMDVGEPVTEPVTETLMTSRHGPSVVGVFSSRGV